MAQQNIACVVLMFALTASTSARSSLLLAHSSVISLSASSPCEMPFRLYHDYVIVVDGTLGDLFGRHLLIDTGSTPTIVDNSVADRLRLAAERSHLDQLNGYTRTTAGVLSSLTLGPITAKSLTVLVTDLSPLEKSLGTRIDAIVGLDVLRASSFLINYDSRRIVFGPIPPGLDSVRFESDPPFVTVMMEAEGESIRLLVDTGASGLLLFNEEGRRFTRLPTLRIESSNNISGMFNRERVGLSNARLGNIDLGRQTAFLVHARKEIFRDFDGLMGIPAIGITQVGFDFEHKILSWNRRGAGSPVHLGSINCLTGHE